MFFKNLKWQLLASGIAAIVVIALMIALVANGYIIVPIILAVMLAAYIVLINVWFEKYVINPIQGLTDSAKRIAEGSYGTQAAKLADNEIGELTDEINEMSSRIALSDQATTEFISQISHELRTPLTAITGWSETLMYDPALDGDSLRGVTIISKEAERLTGMVSDLLEFTRIQDGRFNLRIELVDVAAELEYTLLTYGKLMKQSGVELEYTAPERELPLVPGDPERLKQVFVNLLDNAAKHGGDGKRVEVSLKSEGDFSGKRIVVSIRDHGRGIPENELPFVKNKFYKGSSKNRGSGIGLAVCDEIISRHSGTLDISNAEGGGCLAEIRLPISGK